MEEAVDFSVWLRQRRKMLDLTCQALADQVKCSAATIHKIEQGLRRPSQQIAELLAESLQIPCEQRAAFIRYARGLSQQGQPAPFSAAPPQQVNEAAAVLPGNLPHPSTTFIGREHEIAVLHSLLRQPDVRLVTLTGPGGVGKTRLSIQVAATYRGDIPDGTFFVALDTIRDLHLVESQIAHALGVQDAGSQSLSETLQTYLRSKALLLVLDNFEHILEAAPQIRALLLAAPRLKILVTSRAILHLPEEHEFVVPSLPLPKLGRRLSLPVLSQTASVALFVDRARRVRPEFKLTGEQAPALAEICIGLDGLPLAIELAAARSRLFSPQEMLARLSSRLRLLRHGSTDIPERHRNLRAAIDWSYELLPDDERLLFARLGVFAGGSTTGAVEAICATVKDRTVEVLDGLEALLDHSLIQQRTGLDGQPRLVLLETLREYALEQLAIRKETEALYQQFVDHYLALAEAAETDLRGPRQQTWLDRLESEHDNLRAAIRWLLWQRRAEPLLRLVGALWRFWLIRGYAGEGRGWLEQALVLGEGIDVAVLAKAYKGAGVLAHVQSDNPRALALFEQCLALERARGNHAGVADALNNLASVAQSERDYERARPMFEEAIAVYEQLGDAQKSSKLTSLCNLAVVLVEMCDNPRAMPLLEECLKLAHELGDLFMVAAILVIQGEALLSEGNDVRTKQVLDESLQISRQLGDKHGYATALNFLSRLARKRNDYSQAILLCEESLLIFQESGAHNGVADCFERFAEIAVFQGQAVRAARLLGSSDSLRESIKAPLPSNDQRYLEPIVTMVREQLGAMAWEAARTEGRAMSLEQAIAYALQRE